MTAAGTPRAPRPHQHGRPRPRPPGRCDTLPFRKDLLKHREQKPGHMEHEENAGASLTAAASSGKGPPPRHGQCRHTRGAPSPAPAVPPSCPRHLRRAPCCRDSRVPGQRRDRQRGWRQTWHLLEHHEDAEMDLGGKWEQLGPGRAPRSGRTPAGHPAHPHAARTPDRNGASPPPQLGPPRPDKLFKSSIRKCKKCTRK